MRFSVATGVAYDVPVFPPGLADTPARFPTPVQTEAAAMPAHQRLKLDDNRGFEQGREQPIKPDEDHAICSAQPEPGADRLKTTS